MQASPAWQQGARPSSIPVRSKQTAVSDLAKKAKATLPKPLPRQGKAVSPLIATAQHEPRDFAKRPKATLPKPLPRKGKAGSPLIATPQHEPPRAVPKRQYGLAKAKALAAEESLLSDGLDGGCWLATFQEAKPGTSGPDESDGESSTPEIHAAQQDEPQPHDHASQADISSPESPAEQDSGGDDDLALSDSSEPPTRRVSARLQERRERETTKAAAKAKPTSSSKLQRQLAKNSGRDVAGVEEHQEQAEVAAKANPPKANPTPKKPKPSVAPNLPVKPAFLGGAAGRGRRGGRAGRGRGAPGRVLRPPSNVKLDDDDDVPPPQPPSSLKPDDDDEVALPHPPSSLKPGDEDEVPLPRPPSTMKPDDDDEVPLTCLTGRSALPVKPKEHEPLAQQPQLAAQHQEQRHDRPHTQDGQAVLNSPSVNDTTVSHSCGGNGATPRNPQPQQQRPAETVVPDAKTEDGVTAALRSSAEGLSPHAPQQVLAVTPQDLPANSFPLHTPAETKESTALVKEEPKEALDQSQKIHVLMCADLFGRLDCLEAVLKDFVAKGTQVDFVLAMGNTLPQSREDAEAFQSYCGSPPEQTLPVPVYFIEGDNEHFIKRASKCPAKQEQVFAEHGGKNMITFLGGCGVIVLRSIVIAFLSGRYNEDKFNDVWGTGRFIGMYYTGNAVDELLRQQEVGGQAHQYVDILMTSEWMDKYWSTATQCEASTPVSAEHSSPVVRELFLKLRPRYHVCASANQYHYRKAEQGPYNFVCTSVALAMPAVEQPVVQNGSQQKWYKLISINPGEGLQTGRAAVVKAAPKMVSKSHTLQRKADRRSSTLVRAFDNIPSAEPQVQMPLAIGSKRRHDETSDLPCNEELPVRQQSHSMHQGGENKRQRTESSKLQPASPQQVPSPEALPLPGMEDDDDDGLGTTSPCLSDAAKKPKHGHPSLATPPAVVMTPPVVQAAAPRVDDVRAQVARGGDITPPVQPNSTSGMVTPPVAMPVPDARASTHEDSCALGAVQRARQGDEASMLDEIDPLKVQQASNLLSQFFSRFTQEKEDLQHRVAPAVPVSKAQAPAPPLPLTQHNLSQLEALSGSTSTAKKAEAGLPKGWVVRHSGTYNTDYYFNLESGDSSWEMPLEMPIDRDEL